jgi:hypothetical protein
MDKDTQTRLHAMLSKARSWNALSPAAVEELAEQYGLDAMLVRRALEAASLLAPTDAPDRRIANRPTRDLGGVQDRMNSDD